VKSFYHFMHGQTEAEKYGYYGFFFLLFATLPTIHALMFVMHHNSYTQNSFTPQLKQKEKMHPTNFPRPWQHDGNISR